MSKQIAANLTNTAARKLAKKVKEEKQIRT